MAKEVGQKAVEKQFEIMEEQQQKAQEFIDQKVISQSMIYSVYFCFTPQVAQARYMSSFHVDLCIVT